MQLGAALRKVVVEADQCLILTLALPLSNWAASFLILGYILDAHHAAGADTQADRHFQELMELPCDAPVKLLRGGLQYDAQISKKNSDSVEILYKKHKNKSRLRVSLLCTPANCLDIHFIKDGQFDGVRDRGRKLADSPDFVSSLLHGGDLVTHCVGSRTEYLIFSDRKRMKEELEAAFRCGSHEGSLQDILRVEGLRSGQGYCGRLIPAGSKPQTLANDPDTGLLVYDSATALLRHGSVATAPVIVVLLDRSERHFADAATAIAARYTARLHDLPSALPVNFAESIESISFLERRNR
jgi:hypothetical protein